MRSYVTSLVESMLKRLTSIQDNDIFFMDVTNL